MGNIRKGPWMTLFQHYPGCDPLRNPCVACQAAQFLREKLGPEDLAAFQKIIDQAPSREPSNETPRLTSPMLTLGNIGLSKRSLSALDALNPPVDTLEKLKKVTPAELRTRTRKPDRSGPGEETIIDIRQTLARHGLKMKE